MKKVISLALALVMMLAVCVPAFAADKTINGTAGEDGTAIVKTTTTGNESNYSVTFPAETLITWNATSTDIGYSVSAQLEPDKYLAVSVTGSGTMTDANGKTLAYTLSGDTTVNTTANVVVTNLAKTLKIEVAQANWDNAIISEYQGTLTFTAEVKA